MPAAMTRRAALLGAALVPFAGRPTVAAPAAAVRLAAIERESGGRLGVAALDTGSGRLIARRPGERFPLCSTFKFLAAAAVLRQVDMGKLRLDRKIRYGTKDLLSYAPVTKAHVGEGGMRLGDLCAAAIDWSDNTAGNLLLGSIGGPRGLTRYLRSLGDHVTRLDRTEPSLNSALPGDARDTTTPRAMLHDMQALLLGPALASLSRRQLEQWLIGDQVGAARLRAGFPPSWQIGDKTGSGDNGTANTIAIVWPPDRAPLLVAVYLTGATVSADARNAAHAEVARLLAKTF